MIKPYQIVKDLNFERIGGSEGEKRGCTYIREKLKEIGLNSYAEEFEMYGYTPGNAEITIGDKSFSAYPFGLEVSQNISGKMIFLENSEILAFNPFDYQDKIILTNSYSRKAIDAIQKAKPKAIIVIGKPFKDASTWSHRQKTYENGAIPSLSIDYNQAQKLSHYENQEINITINQETEKKIAQNIIAEIKGTSDPQSYIYAVAHYDTVGRSSGGCDNTGGTAVLLKLAEYFFKHKPSRSIRFIWFSGEEMGLLGSQAYVKQHKDEIKDNCRFLFNFDVAGDDIGNNMLYVMGTKETKGYVEGVTRENGLMFSSRLSIYSSDNMPFSIYEIPSVSVARFGGKASFFGHTKDDNVKFISKRGLQPIIDAGIVLLSKFANAKIFPVEKRIDNILKKDIQKYLWRLNFEDIQLEWTPENKI